MIIIINTISVPVHASARGNECADRLAVLAAVEIVEQWVGLNAINEVVREKACTDCE